MELGHGVLVNLLHVPFVYILRLLLSIIAMNIKSDYDRITPVRFNMFVVSTIKASRLLRYQLPVADERALDIGYCAAIQPR